MLGDDLIETLIHEIRECAEAYAHIKARKSRLEDQKKVVLAREATKAAERGTKTASAQDRAALASEAYEALLEDLENAVEEEARLHWKLRSAELMFESWRTKSANERSEKARYGAH